MSIDRSERTAITVIERPPERAANLQACLVLIHGGELGKRFTLDPPSGVSAVGSAPFRVISVGRSSACEIQLEEDSLSRKHASFLVYVDGRVMVKDNESTNGTYVNDTLIRQELELRDGDRIKVGRTIFKYLTSENIEAQYHEEIYKMTTTDGLTGVFNKRFFMETMEREMGRCLRYKRPLSLLLIDIDHFKRINDTRGHLAGDAVLKQLATLVAKQVRKEDVFARYGGEEFGAILPEVETDGAFALGEKLRSVVEKAVFMWEDHIVPVTISVGVAGLPPEENPSVEAFIQSADECLYAAKHQGRNRVVMASAK
jgi:two-component system, cell cycle response regulator